MILLTSAAYVGQEFGSEFGHIPPAFLPVGNQRLYRHQRATLPQDERVVLTIPDTYELGEYDVDTLRELDVEVLEIPEGLTLGESVVYAINLAGPAPGEPLRILHGDTLIQDLPLGEPDCIGLSEVDGNYNWAVYTGDADNLLRPLDDSYLAAGPVQIANGYFSFSDAGLFVRSVTRMRGNFINGISLYARQIPLTPVTVEDWLDFGHVHTFYRSKSRITTQRAFNEINIGPKTVVKSSRDKTKVSAEAQWFRSIPKELRVFTPHFVHESSDAERYSYEIEYLYLTALNELFVFASLPRFVWQRIFTSCFDFLDQCRAHRSDDEVAELDALFTDKTQRRLARFADEQGVDLGTEWSINGRRTPGLSDICAATSEIIAAIPHGNACVIHGDFCFSNILFDFRTQGIKVIDPRGMDADDRLTIYGPPAYDVAKLAHSAVGGYDKIIAGHYDVSRKQDALTLKLKTTKLQAGIRDMFLSMVARRFDLSETQLAAMQVQLFLSMLPLHSDDADRQLALLANGLRLYAGIDGAG